MLERIVNGSQILSEGVKIVLVTYGLFLGYRNYDIVYSVSNKIQRAFTELVEEELEQDKTYFLRKIVEIKYEDKNEKDTTIRNN